jgi:hypothetical protein
MPIASSEVNNTLWNGLMISPSNNGPRNHFGIERATHINGTSKNNDRNTNSEVKRRKINNNIAPMPRQGPRSQKLVSDTSGSPEARNAIRRKPQIPIHAMTKTEIRACGAEKPVTNIQKNRASSNATNVDELTLKELLEI